MWAYGFRPVGFFCHSQVMASVYFCNKQKRPEMIKRQVIAGDTFPIVSKHKPNGVLQDLPEGYDYMIGLRQEGSKSTTTFSYQNGDISNPETGVYRWEVSHEMSKNLKGDIIVEMVVYSRDASFVKHCSEPIVLEVIPSFMNEQLDTE